MTPQNAIQAVSDELVAEAEAQIDAHGVQNHDKVYDRNALSMFRQGEARWKRVNDVRATSGRITWDGILLEEVFEALATDSDEDTRAELVQAGAVIVSMIASLDRRVAADKVAAEFESGFEVSDDEPQAEIEVTV